jgi:rhodanese-related sulfurtransferase
MENQISEDCISLEEVHELINQTPDKILIIDVRSAEEYHAMHVPNAVNIPVAELPKKLSEIPSDKTIITACYKGGNRSAQGVEILQRLGFTNAKKLCGGTCAWFGIVPEEH